MKKCPYCAEEIQDEAVKCKHCGEFLEVEKEKEKKDNIVEKSEILKEENILEKNKYKKIIDFLIGKGRIGRLKFFLNILA